MRLIALAVALGVTPPAGIARHDHDLHLMREGDQRTADSPVSVWMIPTNEEMMIASHTLACIRA